MIGDLHRKLNEFAAALARTEMRKICRVGGSTLACILSVGATNGHAYSGREIHKSWRNQAPIAHDAKVIVGEASWYGQVAAGRKTATGEKLDPNKLTAASTQLPLQSRAVVTNLDNGRSVRVRINDCGPYVKGRKIDLSKRAAERLAMTRSGSAPVKIQLIEAPPSASYCQRSRPARRSVYRRRRLRYYSR
jgi:rare lipoprotein A